MPADHLIAWISDRAQKVVVGGEDGAVRQKFDHALGQVEGSQLGLEFGIAHFFGGDVGGKLHHAQHLATLVEHWVVRRLDPDGAAVFGKPGKLAGVELARTESLPKLAVFLRRNVIGLAQQAVRLAGDLLGLVADPLAKVGIGRQHPAG